MYNPAANEQKKKEKGFVSYRRWEGVKLALETLAFPTMCIISMRHAGWYYSATVVYQQSAVAPMQELLTLLYDSWRHGMTSAGKTNFAMMVKQTIKVSH